MSLELRNLRKDYDDVVAVDDLSLSADDDDFLVLVGPSGSGKTTTLRMIAGLETPTAGAVSIAGQEVTDRHPSERDIAMVFQNYALYPHMTVDENLSLPLEVEGKEASAIRTKVEETADRLGIGDLLERKPSELSGGQQQRVALGRAIVRDPSVFLMDEPLSNLDAKLRMQMRKEIKELHESLGTTFVYVTHDQTEAMTMGTKIAVLHRGELQQLGTPEELYDNPTNEFVGEFIGSPSMNTFEVTVRDAGSNLVLDTGPFEYAINGDLADAIRSSNATSYTLGVRPEDVVIGNGGRFDAEVTVTEPIGSEIIAYLACGDHEIVAENTRDGSVQLADTVTFDFEQDDIHLFGDGTALN